MDIVLFVNGEGFLYVIFEEAQLFALTVSQNLKRLRLKHNVSVTNLAKRMLCSRTSIYQIENAPYRQPVYRVIQYSSLLGTSFSEMADFQATQIKSANVLIIDNNEDRWNLFQSMFNQYFPKVRLNFRKNIVAAYGCFKEDPLNLIIITHNKKNKGHNLITLLEGSKLNRDVAILLTSKDDEVQAIKAAKEIKHVFFDLNRGCSDMAKIVDDLIRFG